MVRTRLTFVLLVTLLISHGAALADTRDAQAIRQVIGDQITAIQSGHGERAFSFASPGIQQRFRSPTVFMHMIRHAYTQLYRLKSYEFETLRTSEDKTMQAVRIVGPNDRISMAVYQMERQPSGDWKIAGCVLIPLPEQQT